MRVGVHALIFNNDSEVLLVKRSFKDKHDPGTWDLPGGGMDNDNIYEGLRREIREEVEIKVEDIKIIAAYTIEDDSLQLLASCKSLDDDVKLSKEHDKYHWYKEDSIINIKKASIHLKAAQFLRSVGKRLFDYEEFKNFNK